MKGVLVCKTCLVTNVKMFHLDIQAYSEITGLQCDDATTEYVCYQCAALLLKFQQFRTKCLIANQVILDFVGEHCKLTEDVATMIDRKFHNLESTIIKSEIRENIFNEFHKESKVIKSENKTPEQYIKTEFDDVVVATNIKYEVELYYDNKDQQVSNDDDSHLEDNTSLDKEPSTLKVTKEAEAKKKKTKKKTVTPRKKLDFSYMDEYITIVNLTPEEAKQEMLLRKESTNYKTNLYKCDLCYRGFGTPQTHENHMKKHTKESGEYDCEYCHVKISTRRHLRSHILKCHTNKFCCILCPYTCFDSGQAKTHINRHKGKKYPCKECGQIFSMPNSLLTHHRYKHTTQFVCAMCGRIYGKERGLKLHINRSHKQETNEQQGPLCEECDVHFATEIAWKRHLVFSSKHNISNGCEVCGEIFESEEELKVHAKLHPRYHNPTIKNSYKKPPSLKKPIDCTLCEKTLLGKREYIAHMRTDHSKIIPKRKTYDDPSSLPYVCEICGKMFKARALLVYHKRVHTGERPYSCSECGKRFKQSSELSTHLKTHSSSRYNCHLCDKTFVFPGSLYKHLKVHLGIRPYKCNVCDKTFPTPCEVKYHNRHTHQKVPWPKRDRSKRKNIDRESSPASS